jgi:hypothetical protein
LGNLSTILEKAVAHAEAKKIDQVIFINAINARLAPDMVTRARQLPNFYFHVTTTYAILRQNGVDLGTREYLGCM